MARIVTREETNLNRPLGPVRVSPNTTLNPISQWFTEFKHVNNPSCQLSITSLLPQTTGFSHCNIHTSPAKWENMYFRWTEATCWGVFTQQEAAKVGCYSPRVNLIYLILPGTGTVALSQPRLYKHLPVALCSLLLSHWHTNTQHNCFEDPWVKTLGWSLTVVLTGSPSFGKSVASSFGAPHRACQAKSCSTFGETAH